MKTRLAIGTIGALLLLSMAAPVNAYHIVGDVPGVGNEDFNDDPVVEAVLDALVSADAPHSVYSDMFWGGATVNVPGTTVTTTQATVTVPMGPTVSRTVTAAQGTISAGVTICEFDDDWVTLDGIAELPANAGYGGRCSVSSCEAVYVVGTHDLLNDGCRVNAPSIDLWSEVVMAPLGTGCPDVEMFMRVGNNAHGLDVGAGATFIYRELLAYWLSAGHVTTFVDGESMDNPQTCYGNLLGGAATISLTATSRTEDLECNNTNTGEGETIEGESSTGANDADTPDTKATVCTY